MRAGQTCATRGAYFANLPREDEVTPAPQPSPIACHPPLPCAAVAALFFTLALGPDGDFHVASSAPSTMRTPIAIPPPRPAAHIADYVGKRCLSGSRWRGAQCECERKARGDVAIARATSRRLAPCVAAATRCMVLRIACAAATERPDVPHRRPISCQQFRPLTRLQTWLPSGLSFQPIPAASPSIPSTSRKCCPSSNSPAAPPRRLREQRTVTAWTAHGRPFTPTPCLP